MADNLAHFKWTPSAGLPDGYLYETMSGQTGQVYSENLYVPWSWAGSGNPVMVRVEGFRSNILGDIVEVGPPSEWSDPVIVVSEPEGGFLLVAGLLLLALFGRKRRR